MRTHLVRRLAATGVLTLGSLTATMGPAPAASVTTAWAPAATAAIHPGVQMTTMGAQCTANFIFTGPSGTYIGYAAHCAGTGGATDTNGCSTGSRPLGTQVQIGGALQPGTLVYSSWLAMQTAGETNANLCDYNDFALVQIHSADVAKVNPSIPHWGGPVGLDTSANPALSQVYSYGNSGLRFGITQLSPKTGVSLGTDGGGWTHPVYTVTPGIPGDSGSAMLDANGSASGVLSTIALTPLPASNNFTDLNHALAYAQSHGMPGVTLVPGTERFNPTQAPLGI